jgi:hypothetical protein
MPDDKQMVGLDAAQEDAQSISRLIKDRITPLPQIELSAFEENGKGYTLSESAPRPFHPILLSSRWNHGGLLYQNRQ